ncbi:JAB domain-containing protein [Alteromonas aestuariivivens]|uniref:JAB domain-containing protein n=1 Tax=Alteromonas aestuariivivens TaxID=1938339 RepID=A0A3D8M2K7_9ALTE|nr:DNA repair protein RadC [Alteromonas aestuariivivens]RDV23947.1 JAB domain-containing protein [Alteromonas aestuariivivens]
MGVKDWPAEERPREKLIRQGVEQMSDAELLAVLFGSGQRGCSVVSFARRLLGQFGSLRRLLSASAADLCRVEGIGPARYCQLQVVLEMARRHYEEPLKKQAVFNHADDVVRYLKARLRDEPCERFGVLMLDSQHQLIAYRAMFNGTINAAAVYPRELVRQAIADNAAAVILVHNHPSGIAEPSDADIRLTRDVVAAMALLDITVLDHFVVGDSQTVSMAQRGLI